MSRTIPIRKESRFKPEINSKALRLRSYPNHRITSHYPIAESLHKSVLLKEQELKEHELKIIKEREQQQKEQNKTLKAPQSPPTIQQARQLLNQSRLFINNGNLSDALNALMSSSLLIIENIFSMSSENSDSSHPQTAAATTQPPQNQPETPADQTLPNHSSLFDRPH